MHCSAADHIKRGDADLMLAGAGDAAIIPSGIGGFIACKVNTACSWRDHIKAHCVQDGHSTFTA